MSDEGNDIGGSGPESSGETNASQDSQYSPKRKFEFEAERELQLADALIEQSHFGITGLHITPFSAQLKETIRQTFNIDNDVHVAADKSLMRVNRDYIIMRIFTLLFYLSMMMAVSSLLFVFDSNRSTIFNFSWLANLLTNLPGLENNFVGALAYFILIVSFFTLLRLGARAYLRREIMVNGREFSFEVSTRYEDILTRIVECCRNALLQKENWPQRARYWMKIALWCSKRAEYLDRYGTTTGWKAKYLIDTLEGMFISIKAVILLYVALGMIIGGDPLSFQTFGNNITPEGILFAGLITAVTVFGWYFLHRFPGDIWTKVFAQKILDEEGSKVHYFDQISEMVESFVSMIEANQFSRNRNGD